MILGKLSNFPKPWFAHFENWTVSSLACPQSGCCENEWVARTESVPSIRLDRQQMYYFYHCDKSYSRKEWFALIDSSRDSPSCLGRHNGRSVKLQLSPQPGRSDECLCSTCLLLFKVQMAAPGMVPLYLVWVSSLQLIWTRQHSQTCPELVPVVTPAPSR